MNNLQLSAIRENEDLEDDMRYDDVLRRRGLDNGNDKLFSKFSSVPRLI